MIRPALLFLSLCSLVFAADPLPSQPIAFHPGETFHYKVSWAILPGAGEIAIAARRENIDGVPRLVVATTTETKGIAGKLMPFEAKGEATFDLATGRCILLHETSKLRKKFAEHFVTFDYDRRTALYASGNWTEESRELPMPDGNPSDLITTLLSTRGWDLAPGQSRDVLVLFDDDFYQLTIHAERYEDLTTSLGSFHTLVLVPRMEKTPPKGMFKRGSEVRVWISQDGLRLPVRFAVEFTIGTGTATLVSYSAPRSPEPSAATETSDTDAAAPADAPNPRP